ncbi:hypothetical protein C8J57DRAFT_578105 [Mycena rebaudengoi]|nr:hypothetical protein C8J57DRAFT_578105 [Mycena rebaudengoi]
MSDFFGTSTGLNISGGVFNQVTGGNVTQTYNSATQQTTSTGRRATTDSSTPRANNRRRGTGSQIPDTARGGRGGQRGSGGASRPPPTSSQTFDGQMGPHQFRGANSPLALPDPRTESQDREDAANNLRAPVRNQGQRAGGSGQARNRNYSHAPMQSAQVPIPGSRRNTSYSAASNFHRTVSEPQPQTNNGEEGISSSPEDAEMSPIRARSTTQPQYQEESAPEILRDSWPNHGQRAMGGPGRTHSGNHSRAPPQSAPVSIPSARGASRRNTSNSTSSNFHRTISEPVFEPISSSPEDADRTPVQSPSMKQRSLSDNGPDSGSSSSLSRG